MGPYTYTYLVGSLAFMVFWVLLFTQRKDLRKEMWTMSLLVGVLSVATGYYWWTIDWWHPLTITGTRVGIEDFIVGFAAGGVMAVAYEEIFHKKFARRFIKRPHPGFVVILLLLAQTTMWLFYGTGLGSFYASAIAMFAIALLMYWFREDLVINGVYSGLLTVLFSLSFYFTVILIDPAWIPATYKFESLSGLMILGIPIEELIFWFLAGFLFGPLYEYWKGKRLKNA